MQPSILSSYRLCTALLLSLCMSHTPAFGRAAPLSALKVPDGFQIEVFSDAVPGARSLAVDETGTVFVGSLNEGRVYAVRTRDGKATEVRTILQGLNHPNGVAVLNHSLYIAEVSRILRIPLPLQKEKGSLHPEVFYDGLPSDPHHGWRYLRVTPDGGLLTAIGQPCNICNLDDPRYGTLLKISSDGHKTETLARGFRNSVGFDFEPGTQILWASDNGRDWLGDNSPPDELNRIDRSGLHFGFPYCFGTDLRDPQYGHLMTCDQLTPPAFEFQAHVAPLGIRFYTGRQFSERYQHQLLVAQHGSWNRSQPVGYRVSSLRIQDGKALDETPLVWGFLQPDGKVLGRPVDLLILEDGSLLISDDHAGAIYRVTYPSH